MDVNVLASVTLSDESAVEDLAHALSAGDCEVHRSGPSRLDLVLPWGTATAATLEHAWSEVVFFLRAWQANHYDVVLRVEDVHLAPPSQPLAADAA